MTDPTDAGSSTTITVNGRTYHSVEEMPPPVRREYERAMADLMADRDANGVPDVMEGKPPPPGGRSVVTQFTQSQRYVVNGQEYSRLEDVPAEYREALSQAWGSSAPPALPSVSFPHSDGITFHFTPRHAVLLLIAAAIVVATVVWVMSD